MAVSPTKENHMIAKLNRRDLEDRYYSIWSSNIALKKRLNAQNEKIKFLNTKLARLSNQQKKDSIISNKCCRDFEDIIEEQSFRIHQLQKLNYNLIEKIESLEMQISEQYKNKVPKILLNDTENIEEAIVSLEEDDDKLKNSANKKLLEPILENNIEQMEEKIAYLENEIEILKSESYRESINTNRNKNMDEEEDDQHNPEPIDVVVIKTDVSIQTEQNDTNKMSEMLDENETLNMKLTEERLKVLELQQKLDSNALSNNILEIVQSRLNLLNEKADLETNQSIENETKYLQTDEYQVLEKELADSRMNIESLRMVNKQLCTQILEMQSKLDLLAIQEKSVSDNEDDTLVEDEEKEENFDEENNDCFTPVNLSPVKEESEEQEITTNIDQESNQINNSVVNIEINKEKSENIIQENGSKLDEKSNNYNQANDKTSNNNAQNNDLKQNLSDNQQISESKSSEKAIKSSKNLQIYRENLNIDPIQDPVTNNPLEIETIIENDKNIIIDDPDSNSEIINNATYDISINNSLEYNSSINSLSEEYLSDGEVRRDSVINAQHYRSKNSSLSLSSGEIKGFSKVTDLSTSIKCTIDEIVKEREKCKQLLNVKKNPKQSIGEIDEKDIAKFLSNENIRKFNSNTIFILHIVSVELSKEAMNLIQNDLYFLTWKFYKEIIAYTPLCRDQISQFNFTSTYNINMDDDFISYLSTNFIEIDIHKAMGDISKCFARCKINLFEMFSKINEKVNFVLNLEKYSDESIVEKNKNVNYGMLKCWCKLTYNNIEN